MFFKKKPECQTIHLMGYSTQCSAGLAAFDPTEDRIRREVEARHAKKVAEEEAQKKFDAAEPYVITSYYDVKEHKDKYLLRRKTWNLSFSEPARLSYETIFESFDKVGVKARFTRLMKDYSAKQKKAA